MGKRGLVAGPPNSALSDETRHVPIRRLPAELVCSDTPFTDFSQKQQWPTPESRVKRHLSSIERRFCLPYTSKRPTLEQKGTYPRPPDLP
jgi:hypothetical protein